MRDFLTGARLPGNDRDEILAAMKDVQVNGVPIVAGHALVTWASASSVVARRLVRVEPIARTPPNNAPEMP